MHTVEVGDTYGAAAVWALMQYAKCFQEFENANVKYNF